MIVTFLGTGTSYGVPFVGCDCDVCRSTDAHNKRLRSSIAVEAPDENGETFRILVDTTPDLRQQLLRENIDTVSAVLWTHSHNDHVIGLDDIRPICNRVGYINGWADNKTLLHLEQVFPYIFEQNRAHANFPRMTPHEAHPGQTLDLGPFAVTPILIHHGAREILAYRFECNGKTLVYATDCSHIPDTSLQLFCEADVLIVGALRWTEHPTHFNIAQALQVVENVRPTRALFTHIAHDLEHFETNDKLPHNVDLAYDGERVVI